MQYGKLRGIDKPVSRFIVGTMDFRDPAKFNDYFAKLDKAFEYGINTIDTAEGYGMGRSEMAIGQWMKDRGNREQIIITTKCCHPMPWRKRVTWFDMAAGITDSLCRLQTDYIDMILLHRDDPDVPVADIMGWLEKHYKAGQIRAIGVANWQYERIREANEYARANGMPEIVMAEEHYSIAEQIADPFGSGSGSVSGPKFKAAREYFAKENIPIASYSSLSGGFITGRITRELLEKDPDSIDPGVRKAYCHEVNFKRLDRAMELAKEKGVSVAQIGLAYTMSSEMDVYPIIGALNDAEIISSIEAMEMKLTKAEQDWVDCTSDVKP
jgi:aryl-alcohol dehydrogenase-like predicted oxidoreductase